MNSKKSVSVNETSVSCFLDEIPHFVERELTRRYEMLHSSFPFFKVFRTLENVNCYVVWRNRHPIEIILFKTEGRRIEVLNEMIDVEPSALKRFADYIFENFPSIDLISFNALRTSVDMLGFPCQKYNAKDTFVITLPAAPEDYTASIGKSTRASIRQQTNMVRKTFPSFSSEFFVNEEIREDDIRDIIRFSEQRIESKGAKFKHDVERIIALTKICGFVTVFRIDGNICAGSINYRVGRGCFGEVIAYDQQYEKFGLGKLCTHATICESILRGANKFYLGGGLFGFKERMLGKRVDMDQLQIYRSYGKIWRNLDWAMLVFLNGHTRRLKMVLHKRKDNFFSKAAFKFFYALRGKTAK